EAKKELGLIFEKTLEAIELSVDSYGNNNANSIKRLKEIEKEINKFKDEFRQNNIKRLHEKSCSADSSVVFLDLISNLERIGDHADNIGNLGRI
ncbi:MAG: sodium-dependent phosphate transporter, partial [Clostridiales bacterium]|nr:sodium-dependent phosphate transporter [Clostridiales bacterium]